MRRAEYRQRQNAPQIGAGELTSRAFGSGEHQREAHAEQQRKYRPELALYKVGDEPAREPIEAGQAQRHALADGVGGAAEELDVHQKDANQREAAHDVHGGDTLFPRCGRQRIGWRIHGNGHVHSPI